MVNLIFLSYRKFNYQRSKDSIYLRCNPWNKHVEILPLSSLPPALFHFLNFLDVHNNTYLLYHLCIKNEFQIPFGIMIKQIINASFQYITELKISHPPTHMHVCMYIGTPHSTFPPVIPFSLLSFVHAIWLLDIPVFVSCFLCSSFIFSIIVFSFLFCFLLYFFLSSHIHPYFHFLFISSSVFSKIPICNSILSWCWQCCRLGDQGYSHLMRSKHKVASQCCQVARVVLMISANDVI